LLCFLFWIFASSVLSLFLPLTNENRYLCQFIALQGRLPPQRARRDAFAAVAGSRFEAACDGADDAINGAGADVIDYAKSDDAEATSKAEVHDEL
jgi:hypothetical protein